MLYEWKKSQKFSTRLVQGQDGKSYNMYLIFFYALTENDYLNLLKGLTSLSTC